MKQASDFPPLPVGGGGDTILFIEYLLNHLSFPHGIRIATFIKPTLLLVWGHGYLPNLFFIERS